MSKIRAILLQKQSKTNRDIIISMVLNNSENMPFLMGCFFDKDNRMNQNASWPLSIVGEKKPDLIIPYLPKLVEYIDKPKHNSSTRNILRVLQFIDIPEDLEGIVYDKCYILLDNPKTAVAIRVFAMTLLTNIAIKYPDLKEELIKTIELYYAMGSPGYQSRAKREIKRLKK